MARGRVLAAGLRGAPRVALFSGQAVPLRHHGLVLRYALAVGVNEAKDAAPGAGVPALGRPSWGSAVAAPAVYASLTPGGFPARGGLDLSR